MDRYYHLVLLAENDLGYHNLMKIVSRGFTEGYYYKPRVDLEVLQEFHEGIIALSACLAGEVQKNILRGMYEEGKAAALKVSGHFRKRKFLPGITGSRNAGTADREPVTAPYVTGDRDRTGCDE